jgi:hypothetical protein
MVRAANYATTTGKIAVDGVTAPASTLCDLPAGHPLKSGLDCQTPYVVAWSIPFHAVPSQPSATLPVEQHCGVAIFAKSTPRLMGQNKSRLLWCTYRAVCERAMRINLFRDESTGGVFLPSLPELSGMNIPPVTKCTE